MKKCPFCAEEIQDAAVVCKHCGRDLIPGRTTTPASAPAVMPPPKKKTGIVTWLVAVFFGLMFVGWCSSLMNPPSPKNPRATTSPASPAGTPPRTEALALVSMTDEISPGGSYAIVQGEVENISGQSLKNVAAVATWYDKDGGFIVSDTTLIEYNPILPGQRSPYKVMSKHNPAMTKYAIAFKSLFGGAIASRDDRKK